MHGMTVNQLKKVFRSGKTFYRVIFNQIEVVQLVGSKFVINQYGETQKIMGRKDSNSYNGHRWEGAYFLRDLQGHNGSGHGCACFDTVRKAERFIEYCIANDIKKDARDYGVIGDYSYDYEYNTDF